MKVKNFIKDVGGASRVTKKRLEGRRVPRLASRTD